jgi:hypothetical protein
LPRSAESNQITVPRPPPLIKSLLVFILVIAAVFFAGAVVSYPLYYCLSRLADLGYHKVLHYSILLSGLTLGVGYLQAARQLTAVLGWKNGRREITQALVRGFAAGVFILLIIELCLSLLGMRQADPDLYNGLMPLLLAIVKAITTGFTVALLEETLYRGAIYTGLARYTNAATALILSSLFYGAAHFIDMPELPAGMAATWLTGFNLLAGAFVAFTDPFILDALITLTLLGVLLGLLRRHTGNIFACIGVHAGIVTINKIFAYATDYQPGTRYAWLVNSYDHQTGLLASFWLALVCLFYIQVIMRKGNVTVFKI